MLREIVEAIGWKKVQSKAKGANKGVTLLHWEDGKDYVTIARASEDRWHVASATNDGSSDGVDWDQDLDSMKTRFEDLRIDDLPNLPSKFPKKILLDLPNLIDEEDDWDA